MFSQQMENLLFQVSHLQRAHLFSIYIEQLVPTAQDLAHYDRGTLHWRRAGVKDVTGMPNFVIAVLEYITLSHLVSFVYWFLYKL